MKVNKFGKAIMDKGYKSFNDFLTKNDIKKYYSTIQNWIVRKMDVSNNSLYIADTVADALGVTRHDLLDMIATDPIYDIKMVRDYKPRKPKSERIVGLKALRVNAGMQAQEVAELIGDADAQLIYDIENGKTRNFRTSQSLKNYMELFDLSFTQLVKIQDELCGRRVAEERPYRQARRFEKRQALANKEDHEEIVAVLPLPEVGATPVGYETKPIEPVEAVKKADEVIRIIYGKVDYDTFRAVEKILREAEL